MLSLVLSLKHHNKNEITLIFKPTQFYELREILTL